MYKQKQDASMDELHSEIIHSAISTSVPKIRNWRKTNTALYASRFSQMYNKMKMNEILE